PLGHHPLELRVLGFEFPKPLHVGRIQLAKPLAPAIQRLLADLVFAGDLGHRRPVRLPQDRDHLFFSESALSHGLLASGARAILSTYPCAENSGHVTPTAGHATGDPAETP